MNILVILLKKKQNLKKKRKFHAEEAASNSKLFNNSDVLGINIKFDYSKNYFIVEEKNLC